MAVEQGEKGKLPRPGEKLYESLIAARTENDCGDCWGIGGGSWRVGSHDVGGVPATMTPFPVGAAPHLH